MGRAPTPAPARQAMKPGMKPAAIAAAKPAAQQPMAQRAATAKAANPPARPVANGARSTATRSTASPAKAAAAPAEEIDPNTGEVMEADPGVVDGGDADASGVDYGDGSGDALPAAEGDDEVINFDNVSDAEFETLPKGRYPCAVDETEFLFAKSSGAPMIKMTLVVDSGEFEGRKAWNNLVFTPKALPIVKRTLLAFGVELPTGDITMGQLKQWARDLADQGYLIGAQGVMVIKHREYNGEMRAEVARVVARNSDVDTSGDDYMAG